MDGVTSNDEEEKLKLLVYRAVSVLSDDVGKNNSLLGKFDITSEAKVVITELMWKKMEQYAEDLEAFAQHAKRNQINIEDVKLLFRRNEKIMEEIAKLESEDVDKPVEKGGKRKRSTAQDKEAEK